MPFALQLQTWSITVKTIFDLLTVALFAGLVVLFLKRSLDQPEGEPYADHLWQYLLASVGCAVANYLGNEGDQISGLIVLMGALIFTVYVLKPFKNFPPR